MHQLYLHTPTQIKKIHFLLKNPKIRSGTVFKRSKISKAKNPTPNPTTKLHQILYKKFYEIKKVYEIFIEYFFFYYGKLVLFYTINFSSTQLKHTVCILYIVYF